MTGYAQYIHSLSFSKSAVLISNPYQNPTASIKSFWEPGSGFHHYLQVCLGSTTKTCLLSDMQTCRPAYMQTSMELDRGGFTLFSPLPICRQDLGLQQTQYWLKTFGERNYG